MSWSPPFNFVRQRGHTMSELPDAGEMLVAAERAASTGDLASADELLRNVARVQETKLGPLHPDLASTLNNLAIVAEKTGRQREAETFYRRAAAIASASLPADHPMVAASRQNLEDFCRSCDLPIEAPALASPRPPSRPPPRTLLSTLGTASDALTWGAIGGGIVVTAALLAMRPWSSRERSISTHPAESVAASHAGPSQPASTGTPSSTARLEESRLPKAPPTAGNRVTDKPPAPTTSVPITLTSAEVCETFSPRGDDWHCKRAGHSVAPGAIVLYTRVRSSRDSLVMHRWYLENALQQSVRLMTSANDTAGYRTYSRQSVNSGEHWRVEVASASGAVLYEQRFAVR
jgi:Tetratricopeptide repeat/Protein of unknown function (DUF2914)